MNMKINQKIIEDLMEKYSECVLEEIYENHESMGNYCCITSDITLEEDEMGNTFIYGEVYDLIDEICEYENIKNFENETFLDDEPYEYITFEWNDIE